MTQQERILWLIRELIDENRQYKGLAIPNDEDEQKKLLRSLMNVREPREIDEKFLRVQDAYLAKELSGKTITSLDMLVPMEEHIYLWRGDITTMCVDAIVNAANSTLLGCFVPCHSCVDNAIHSVAGIQLRLKCKEIMDAQGFEEPVGCAKITPAYNLPCNYVIHTVGPIVRGELTMEDCRLLASCYRSCLELAFDYGLKSIAFCCISTGEFRFPNKRAAEIAVNVVRDFILNSGRKLEVIFNVFKQEDYSIYKGLL